MSPNRATKAPVADKRIDPKSSRPGPMGAESGCSATGAGPGDAGWEPALQDPRASFDEIWEHLPILFYVATVDPDGRFRFSFVSRYALVMTGFAPEEIRRQPELLVERFHPEDVAGWREELARTFRERRDWYYELRYRHKAGHFIWIRSQAWRAYREDGTVQVVGFWMDISRDREADLALHRQEARYRGVTDNALAGIAVIDEQSRFLFVNSGLAEMFGYASSEEVTAIPHSTDMVHPDDAARMDLYRAKRLRGENPPPVYEARGYRKDGSMLWFANAVRAIEWEGRTAFQFVCIDITEQKHAEEALRASERRYRDLIEQAPQGIMIHTNMRPRFANEAFVKLLGYASAEELIGLGSTVPLMHPDEVARMKDYQARRDRGERVPTQYEARVLRKDGETVWVSVAIRRTEWEGEPATQAVWSDITERVRAEEALRASEDRYRQLVEESLQGMAIVQDGVVLYANRAFATIFGYHRAEEVVGTASEAHWAPHERPRMHAYRAARKRGEHAPTHYVFEGLRKDGGRVWVENRVNEILWNGRPAIQVAYLDVTERRRAEEALRTSEERYRDLAENSVQGMCIVQGGRIVYTNEAEAEIFGFASPTEMVGLEFASLYTEESGARQRERSRLLAAGQRVEPTQYEAIHRNGHRIWVQAISRRIDWEGRPAILGVHVDITEQRRAEDALRKSEQRYRDLVENSMQGMRVSKDDRVVFANQSEARIFGYDTAQEMIGAELDLLYNDDVNELRRHRAKSVFKGEEVGLVEVEANRKDGQPIWVQTMSRAIEWDGEPAILALHLDMTEQRRTQEALRESELRYRDLIENAVQGIFIQHDFRPVLVNPACARLLGYSSPDEVLALPTVMEFVHPEERARITAYNSARRSGGAAPESYEFRALRKDGSAIWVSIAVRAVTWEGQPAHQGVMVDISQRKNAERALQESERRYRDLIENSAQGILIHSEFRYLFVNRAYAQIFGYDSPEELMALGHTERLVHPDDQARLASYNQVRAKGSSAPERYDFRGVRKDGETIWVNATVRRIEWEGLPATQSVCVDVTDQRRAEEALRNSEMRYRDLVEGSLQGMFIRDTERIVFANQAIADILGYPNAQAVLDIVDPVAMFQPAARERIRRYAAARLRGARVQDRYESEAIRHDGTPIWVEILSRAVRWEGKPAIQVIMYDITERRRAAQALDESRAYLAAVLDTAVDGIITIDRHGTVETVNRAAEKLFGYSRAEVIGRNISMLVPPPHRERHQEYIERYLRTGESQIIGIGREAEAQHKDGTIFPVAIDVSEVRSGGRLAFTAMVKDITEKKLQERALVEMAQTKSVMLSSLSHEMRTPLTSILGFAQLMRREPNLSAEQSEDVRTIEQSAHHLLELINDVLDVQKMEAGFLKLNREDFDLYHTLDSLIAMFRARCEEKDVTLKLKIEPDVPRYVNGDPRKLRQVLINLMGNAVKFTDHGGVEVRLSMEPSGAVRFAVKDTGGGIPGEELDEIMKPFRQSSTARGGTGLGLAISKGLVELMGGALEVESELGFGSIFSFVLTFAEMGTSPDAATEPRSQAEPRGNGKGIRVLIVDDDASLREWLRRLLRSEGYATEEADDGRVALRRFAQFRPHLVLMDLRMPVMNGAESIRSLRAMKGGAEVPIVILSAESPDGSGLETPPDGPLQRTLTKPIESGLLLDVVGLLLPEPPPEDPPASDAAPAPSGS